MKKNFESVYFLRNGKVLPSHSEALESIDLNSSKVGDGEALLARYKDENDEVKTIVGYKYEMNGESSLTVIDIEGIEKEIEDVENKIPDVSRFINNVEYEEDGENHSIIFYHDNVVIDSIDATPFLIDGMIENVYIEDGYLVIDFNTASGKQDISIPLTDIFDPSNYYNKTTIDTLVGSGFTSSSITDVIIENKEITSAALTDLDNRKLDASAYTPTDLSNYYTKSETSGASEIQDAIDGKADVSHDHDDRYYSKEYIDEIDEITSASLNDLEYRKLDSSAYTPTDLSGYYTKSETSGATEISDALDAKASVSDDLDNIKLKKITSSDYNALVDAGTVDPNTLYIVTD